MAPFPVRQVTIYVVMAETRDGSSLPRAVFDQAYKAHGEAWRLRKYGCREARVVEFEEFELNERGHEK